VPVAMCSALLCDTRNTCNSVTVFCCVILSVSVSMWHCSVVLYCECLYPRGSALLSDIFSAFTNCSVLCCVLLSVPLPTWQSSVPYQCGSCSVV